MNNEQLFLLAVIVILNIAAYLIDRHDGKNKGYRVAVKIIDAVAPEEMAVIREKIDKIDPVKFAFEIIMKDRVEGK